MARQDDSGNKTEKATPKRLRDARKRGEVPKSRDLTGTLGLAFTLVLFALVLGDATERLAALLDDTLRYASGPFEERLASLGTAAVTAFLTLSALILVPVAAFGLLVEFLQTGPVLTFEKIRPKLSNLDPVGGVKRMFGLDNLVEVAKSIAKTAFLFVIAFLVVRSLIDRVVLLPAGEPLHLVAATAALALRLFGWTLGVFLVIMALDASYQQYSFAKRMKMSVRDIRQEHKDNEGDPQMKGQRKQMHREWAQEGATRAASDAAVLVVNPTHVAVAIAFDRERTPVPTVSAKGELETARAMREAANRAHVPVLRNERLARTLLADVEEGDPVPRELFDVVAEVILWATRTQGVVARQRGERVDDAPLPAPPGEDLTDYPLGRPTEPLVSA